MLVGWEIAWMPLGSALASSAAADHHQVWLCCLRAQVFRVFCMPVRHGSGSAANGCIVTTLDWCAAVLCVHLLFTCCCCSTAQLLQ
jgi:hypothetical protein